jgi:hypothetical protein
MDTLVNLAMDSKPSLIRINFGEGQPDEPIIWFNEAKGSRKRKNPRKQIN